ncbi:MAG TPA: 4Fe-4S binding protein, partial [Bacteroidales bacterium]|nr:4Fe-4S binding protein [Bacteroidales bacterium]
VINLSMACNHCAEPACASGCPALAYTISPDGVVIHHTDRCMGCGYCTWRCPYGAPKINPALGYIEKCHFCADRTTQGVEPACVTACPTGALKMTEREEFDGALPAWFPDTGIKPSVFIKNAGTNHKPFIIPAGNESEEDVEEILTTQGTSSGSSGRLKEEWSLALFSVLVITAYVILIVSALRGTITGGFMPFILMVCAMAVSVVHLGVPGKSWRAVLNLLSSPLSREIAMVLMLAFVALLEWMKPDILPPLVTGLLALLTLISIDNVYFAADRSFSLKLHSGQAFFTGLYAATWFIEPTIIFIVLSMLAAISVVMRYRSSEADSLTRALYYTRAMALPMVFMLIYPDSPVTDIAALVIFITGLMADRLLFYCDFRPPNIKDTITEHFAKEYEKERDKQRQDAGIS